MILIDNQLFINSSLQLPESNCTGNCVESFRRKWPKLDFEFYHDHHHEQNHSFSENNSFVDFPYSLISPSESTTTSSIISSSTIKPTATTNINNQTGKNYLLKD